MSSLDVVWKSSLARTVRWGGVLLGFLLVTLATVSTQAGEGERRIRARHQHVVPLSAPSAKPVYLGTFIKRDYHPMVFRTRFKHLASGTGAARLMIHVDARERYPVIVNTIQIRHRRERVAYHLGRRMVPGWNEIPLDRIPWRKGELIISFDHGRGSRVGIYLGGYSRRPSSERFHQNKSPQPPPYPGIGRHRYL